MFKILIYCLMLSFTLLHNNNSQAQHNSHTLFDADVYKAMLNDINSIFTQKKNDITTLKIATNTTLKIAINMNVWNDANTQTIGGKLIDYIDAYITMTAYTYKGVYYITGSIISKANSAGFKINLKPDGKVYLEKVLETDIVTE